MTTEEIVRKLEPWLARHRRPAWRPVVEDGDGPATVSKFCGTPWVGPDAPWPACGHCHQPLQLFVQLDLAGLPDDIGRRFGTGLLQLFYCTRAKCQGRGGWEPFANDLSRVRVVHPTGPGTKASASRRGGSFPAKRIVGWERFLDLPHTEEHRELGVTYVYDPKARAVRLVCEELGLVCDNIEEDLLRERIGDSKLGDKLAGWPAWVQSVEYPDCPRCGLRMAHVFQVESRDHIPFMFGDAGCGHITQCPDHKEVVAFGWACC
jgi:hypothetical protein